MDKEQETYDSVTNISTFFLNSKIILLRCINFYIKSLKDKPYGTPYFMRLLHQKDRNRPLQ
jgi:hypothetical protein